VVPRLETGGAERTTIEIAGALVAAGERAIVVSEGGRMLAELLEAGAEHVAMPVAAKRPLTVRGNAARLADLMEREAVDIIHARSRAPAWSALWAASWTYRPLVTTYHAAYNARTKLKRRYNSVMARGDRVIANSAFIAGLIAERHPFARGRIVTIPRGVDLSRFDGDLPRRAEAIRAQWGVNAGETIILHLARLTPLKGQEVLLDALAHLARRRAPDWRCVLAGDDQGRADYSRRLREKARGVGLEERVLFVGHVSDPAAACAAATVAAQPSVEPEGFGRAVVEAQAAQVPIIVSDHGPVRETVLAPPEVAPEDRTGWRVPPGDAVALADALSQALHAGEDARRAIGRNGRAHAFANFSLGAMKQKTLGVYHSLLEDDVSALY
jgi:glycosyltransferase involved in cell wall biosynthesis